MATEDGRFPVRPVTRGPHHHFFGYYDKPPWDAAGQCMLALQVPFGDRQPQPDDAATVGVVDLGEDCAFRPLAETRAWNWQQGTMLQWVPSAPNRLIAFNDRQGDTFVGVLLEAHTGERRVLPRPIYALSRDGLRALSVNFARLNDLRPGYGYAGPPDPWREDPHPDDDGIYIMDLATGDRRLIMSLDQIAASGRDETMAGRRHWFNHLLFNTDDSRFIFLHRWQREDGGRYTRMFTARPDGSEVCCVSDHEMVSHFDWRDERHILAWARRRDVGDRYFLFTDCTDRLDVVAEGVLTTDGHCSYSPDRRWILTDTYPDRERMRTLILYEAETGRRVDIGRLYSPPELDGPVRCDLHPRWSRDGRQVCIDSAHEGTRQMYVIDVSGVVG
ncbi:MAG: hypothetical protein JSV65_19900 [Armatimonadota bacterium]|nr:MAG: hypothetical protein JSV65_19900 [Armatimonadota bacterium]